jgi:hypothetical protein
MQQHYHHTSHPSCTVAACYVWRRHLTCGCGALLLLTTAMRLPPSSQAGHSGASEPVAALAAAASSSGTQLPPHSGLRTRSTPALQPHTQHNHRCEFQKGQTATALPPQLHNTGCNCLLWMLSRTRRMWPAAHRPIAAGIKPAVSMRMQQTAYAVHHRVCV